MAQETSEQTFHVSQPARLRLTNIRGSVEIQPGESDRIEVVAVKQTDSGDADHTEVRMEQQADGRVVVETYFQKEALVSLFSHPCKIDYQVKVPQQCSLDLSGVSNTTSVRGIDGTLKVQTVSGDIALRALKGGLDLHSVSGQVSGDELSGSLAFDTVSGNLRLVGANFSHLQGSTVSGSVYLQTPLEGQEIHLRSVSGSVYLEVPAGTGCTVISSSISGRINTNLPVQNSARSSGKRRMQLGSGGPTVVHNSVSGSLSVMVGSQSGNEASGSATVSEPAGMMNGGDFPFESPASPDAPPAPPTPPTFPTPSTSSENTQPSLTNAEILDKIERGELTVEEGIKLMKK